MDVTDGTVFHNYWIGAGCDDVVGVAAPDPAAPWIFALVDDPRRSVFYQLIECGLHPFAVSGAVARSGTLGVCCVSGVGGISAAMGIAPILWTGLER